MKRIFLFLATNIAVLLVIGTVSTLSGIGRGGNLGSVLAWSALVGFTGSIVSLLMSKTMAKHSVGAQVITQPRNETEAWLLQTVSYQAQQWNLSMPEVAVYQSPEPNAFATGASRNNSLVAVSTGLLARMSRDEVEAVLAQGVVNTFVVFFSRIIASAVASANSNGRQEEHDQSGGIYLLVYTVLQLLFGVLASLIVHWFSRKREYRADAGAAKLVGAPKMIAALQRLKGQPSELPQDMVAMGIASENKDSWFSTHPSLDNRIARLKMM